MRAFGNLLWEMGRVEACALSVMTLVKDDVHLTAPERRFIESRLLPQEQHHAAQTRRWAAKWAGAPRTPRDGIGALVALDTIMAGSMPPTAARFAWILAVVHWNEANTVKAYTAYLPAFARVSTELAQDFSQILAEEVEHVAWGRAVFRRLEIDDLLMTRRLDTIRPLVRRVYGTVVREFHTKLMKALPDA